MEDNDSLVDFLLDFGQADEVHFYTTPVDDGIAVRLVTEGATAHYIEDLKELDQLLRIRGKSMREWKALRQRLRLPD